MKRIGQICIAVFVVGTVAACGGRDGGDSDSDTQFGYRDYGATPGDYGQMMDSIFQETSDGQFIAETPSQSLSEPVSASDMQALTEMLAGLGGSQREQVQLLVLDMLDACRFFGGGNRPCSAQSPWGCATNLVNVGGGFFMTLMGHLGSAAPLSSNTDPADVMAEEVGLCGSVPINSPNFKVHMEKAKQQCIRGDLRGCIRFGLSLIKTFLKALLGAILGGLGI